MSKPPHSASSPPSHSLREMTAVVVDVAVVVVAVDFVDVVVVALQWRYSTHTVQCSTIDQKGLCVIRHGKRYEIS